MKDGNGNKINKPAQSIALAARGIKTSADCSNFLMALAMDVLSGAITPQVCNSSANAIGKAIRVKELEIKHGTTGDDGPDGSPGTKRLQLN